MKALQTAILLAVLLVASIADAQQVIGQYPTFDGGFESQTTGNLVSISVATNTIRTDWTVNNGTGLREVVASNGRSGPKYVRFSYPSASSARRLQSPTTSVSGAAGGSGAILNSTSYTIQYYYRTEGNTAPLSGTVRRIGIGVDGSLTNVYATNTLAASQNTWTKATTSVTSSSSAVSPRYGLGIVQVNNGATADTVILNIDDFVVYAGSVDNTVPDPVTSPSLTSVAATQQTVNWTAPVSGIDGGGYMVVRGLSDPATTPNQNGIYAVSGTVATGEQVVYLGTNTSFTDLGLSASTQYYYRIYTVDKAFNYSSAATINGSTTAPSFASEPSTQASAVVFSNVTATSFDIAWTNGDGSNRAVLIRSGSDVNTDPSDGNSFTANTAFASGTQVGTGNYVVYNGTGSGVSVTGLSKATRYYVKIYEFNGSSGTENYLTSSAATGNYLTLPGSVTSNGTGGGTWGTGSTWSGGVVPTAGDSVTIAAGDIVTLASTGSCFSLNVLATGKLYTNVALPTSSVVYLRVYGRGINILGTLGGDADAIGIEYSGDITMTGNGTIRPARTRPVSGVTNSSITFDADVTYTYTGSTGTGSSGISFDNTGNDNITMTVNSGRTVTFVDFSYIYMGSSGLTNTNVTATININGTVDLSGANSNMVLAVSSGKNSTLNIGAAGLLKIGKSFTAGSFSGGTAPTIVNNGEIRISGTADFSNALSATMTGTGTFTLQSGATMSINAASGLDPATGPIRTSTRSFSETANYSFVGSALQSTGSDLPSSVNNLTVNNASGVTLTNSVTVNGTMTLTSGVVTLGSNNLTVSAVSGTTGSGTMIVPTGTGELRKKFTGNGTFIFPVGDNTDIAEYSPVSVTMSASGYSSAYVGVRLNNAKEASNSSAANYINRYWVLSGSGITSPSYTATFTYLTADVVGTENSLYGAKYEGVWELLNAVDDGAHTFSGTGLTTFSTFTAGENTALPVELTSFSVHGSHRSAELTWSTATEQNNYGFQIERRTDRSGWVTAGFVKGAGNSNVSRSYAFKDETLVPGTYEYRLKQIDTDGSFKYAGAVERAEVGTAAKTFGLSESYPNPFNPTTNIEFTVAQDGPVSLKVYNMIGQEVASLFSGIAAAGRINRVTFDAAQLPSGIYFSKLQSGSHQVVRKMMLMK